jgi:DNA topoisomerase-1
MPDAEYDVTTLDITANGADNKNYLFRASGRIEKFPGFKILTTDDESSSEESDSKLPVISENELLHCQKITPNQKFTQPPPRFNEASLIRTLEESGIGRPSTYASIINTIISRQYVERKQRALHPTNIGIAVSDFLNENFPDVIDVGFTAQIEEQLDNIDESEQSWAPMLTEFYEDFEPLVSNVLETADRVPREKLDEMTDHICSECNSPMVIRLGRNGKFIACTAFPECRQTMAIDENGDILPPRPTVEPEETEEICDKCNSPMVIKRRRSDNGKFMACSAYPKCRNAKSMPLGIKCPECEEGDIVERRSRRRGSRTFFGCSRYPDCEYFTNDPPITQNEKVSTTSSNS